jgi:hypothetical protein
VILKQLIFVSEWNGWIGYFSTFHIFQKYFLFFGISENNFFLIFQKDGNGRVKNDFKNHLNLDSEWNGWIGYFTTFHFFQKYFLFFGISENNFS